MNIESPSAQDCLTYTPFTLQNGKAYPAPIEKTIPIIVQQGQLRPQTGGEHLIFKNQNDGLINFKKFNTRHSPFYFKGTGDGGKTWEKRTFAPFAISDSVVFSKIAFVPGSQSTWVGNYRVYKNKRSSPGFAFSKDDGKTWIPVPLEAANMNVIKTELLFINDHTGWAAGNSVNPTKYGIYKWTGVLPE